MPKLTRKTNVLFAGAAVSSELAQFGSTVANSPAPPVFSTDPAVLQANAAWPEGWQDAIFTGDKAPVLEEMNAVCYVLDYQLSYLFQEGVPEWDSGTTYYLNSVVKLSGTTQLFGSLQDNNTGNTPPTGASNAFWQWLNPPLPFVPNFGNSLKSNLQVFPDGGSPSTQVDIQADTLSVQDVVLQAVNVHANIGASGAGGLDTGSPSNNTWYAVFVIANASGSLSSGLLSLSPTAPTLPGGYTVFRRVGWVYNRVGNDLHQSIRVGETVRYISPNSDSLSTAGGVTSFAAEIPPNVRLAQVFMNVAASQSVQVAVRTPGTASYLTVMIMQDVAGVEAAGVIDWLTDTSQQLDFHYGTGGTVTSVNGGVTQYYDPV